MILESKRMRTTSENDIQHAINLMTGVFIFRGGEKRINSEDSFGLDGIIAFMALIDKIYENNIIDILENMRYDVYYFNDICYDYTFRFEIKNLYDTTTNVSIHILTSDDEIVYSANLDVFKIDYDMLIKISRKPNLI